MKINFTQNEVTGFSIMAAVTLMGIAVATCALWQGRTVVAIVGGSVAGGTLLLSSIYLGRKVHFAYKIHKHQLEIEKNRLNI